MNVYHRLLNILAETTQPEYWNIDELIHYIDLAQRKLAKDSRLYRSIKRLVPAIDPIEPASRLPATILTKPSRGLYQVPEDCLEIDNIYWNGKLLDKANLVFLNSRFAGISHFAGLKGKGRHFEEPVKDTEGEPDNWTYDNGIRLVPCHDDIDFCFVSMTEYDMNLDAENEELQINDLTNYFASALIETERPIDSETCLYVQFARVIKVVDGVRYLNEGEWQKLKFNKDYFISSHDGFQRILLSDELIHRISCTYSTYTILPTFLFINPSVHATIDYIAIPKIRWDIKTLNDKGVELELPERHHEAIADYAAFLALSKEGRKTQDVEKAQIYLQRFTTHVGELLNMTKGSVNVDYANKLPFRL